MKTTTKMVERVLGRLAEVYGYEDSGEFEYDAVVEIAREEGSRKPGHTAGAVIHRLNRRVEVESVEMVEIKSTQLDRDQLEAAKRGEIKFSAIAHRVVTEMVERRNAITWFSVPVPT